MGAFGLLLGAGLVTPFTAAATYAFVALVLLSADPLLGAVLFAAYGGTRALASMCVAGITMARAANDLSYVLQRTKDRWRPALGLAAAAAAGTFVLLGLPRP